MRTLDSLDAYLATLSEDERDGVEIARVALDPAILFERSRIDILRRYLSALGYEFEISVMDVGPGRAHAGTPAPGV